MMRNSVPLVAVAVAILMLSIASSFASRATADACAARLPADAKLIYAASIGGVAPGVDLHELEKSKARSLVMSSRISRDAALPAAQAAGACLKQAL
jgi:hypothetical protein